MPISYVRKMKGLGPDQAKRKGLGCRLCDDLVVESSAARM